MEGNRVSTTAAERIQGESMVKNTGASEKPGPFEYVGHDDNQRSASIELRQAADSLLQLIETHVPAGRYKALAVTALETVAMWAIKGLTHS